MALPWLKVATDFAEHPKAVALANRLSDPRGPLHLPPVWGHFARHYADGSMPDTEDAIRALERAALWSGEPGGLVAALVAVGLLERSRKRISVHGWLEWQEGHARKLERDRERMRAKRAAEREERRATVERGSRDRRGTEERERRGEEKETPPSPSPTAPAPRRATKGTNGKAPDPRHHPLQQLLEGSFLELRGTTYGFQGGRDAKAISQLLQLAAGDAAEVDRRWRRALELGERWPGCSTIALLSARWNELAQRNGAPVPAMPAESFSDTGFRR